MPRTARFDVGGLALAVNSWPAHREERRPVVLLPATGRTADDWAAIAPSLASTRAVHAVDLRGHGSSDRPGVYSITSMADDVVALIPQLEHGPLDLVAHSLGGLVACAVAATRPVLVTRLVLEDVGLLRPRPPGMPERPPGELRFDWRMVEQIRPEIDDPDPAWAATVASIVAPVLVVAGGPTSTVPQEHVADLARTAPDGELVALDTGHHVHETDPSGFLRLVLGFLDR